MAYSVEIVSNFLDQDFSKVFNCVDSSQCQISTHNVPSAFHQPHDYWTLINIAYLQNLRKSESDINNLNSNQLPSRTTIEVSFRYPPTYISVLMGLFYKMGAQFIPAMGPAH